MRKYLFIAANEGNRWGGSELLWSQAAEKLVRKGNEVRVSAKYWDTPVPEVQALEKSGCQVFYRRPPSLRSRLTRKLVSLPNFSLQHLKAVGRGVDLVVISQGYNADGQDWMEASLALGIKYAPIIHSAVVYWWPSDDRAEQLAKCYAHASCSYFVSEASLALSRQQFGYPHLQGKIVRNPFNVAYDASPPWPGDPQQKLSLAFVARLDVVSKAHDILLQVLGLPHWRDREIHVSLVGYGPHERCLRKMVEQLKLDNVSFSGHLNNIVEVWNTHHALILPSRFEGMPLTVVEAMLCGRPCIVTDVGGNRELVQDARNGFIVQAPTVELLDETLNRVWNCRALMQEMGVQASKDVRKFVGPDPAQDFVDELEGLIG